jgi:homoserine dehydrogenase
MSRIAQCFADEGVSIAAVTQKGEQRDGRVTLVVITHVAGEKSMQRSIAALCRIATLMSIIRVEQE